ncbi:unnamed protein product [Cylindrotheca closterium]|uniref:Kinesin motor domain-containing protein n=1 Tax=Cylindrotheca closterium TaxID=2856 RepID=A0AAD2JLZ3_9STRA|nr:unnamed protein product [Cylindrotheca closterium]
MGQTKRESTAPNEKPTSRKRRRTIAPSDNPPIFEIKGNSTNDAKNVRVVARIRPLSRKEQDQKMILKPKDASIVLDNGDDRKFDYDAVLGPNSTQWDVYHQSGARDAVCGDILQGFNCTILAYGQTGSGKTFTMGTASSDSSESGNSAAVGEMDGIIPRAVTDLFAAIARDAADTITVEMSFLEIYNEDARDLLSEGNTDTSPSLFIREGQDGEVYVQNLTWKTVSSQQDVAEHMIQASDRRVVASTHMNATSSRSHAICTLRITTKSRAPDGSCNETKSKLTLVDLAGSERAKRTGAEGSRMKEGININKGLFVLGQVVSCLSQLGETGSSSQNSQHHHIPYRDSKLTRLLQDSLGGNSRTIMLACVSPADSNTEESVNTLRYASRARSIQNSAVKNVVEAPLSPEAAAVLRKENQDLRKRVIQLESQLRENGGSTKTHPAARESKTSDFASQSRICELECMVDHLKEQVRSASKDVLNATAKADQYKIKHDELLSLCKNQGLKIDDEDNTADTEKTLSLVHQLREEVEEWKAREAEARINAEVSRVTAASILSSGGELKIENIVLPMDTEDDNDEELEESDDGAHLASELLCISGSIDKKEEMVKKAMLEKQCMEAMKSHFEGALHHLQTEVETLSAEREELLSVVDCITDDNAAQSQMQSRIAALENRIADLNKNADDHKKSLRLRELAEKRVSKLEQEIQADKQKKAELQRKLKEESVERRKDKKSARLEATRLMKDSNRLKLELQKVKSAAERQAQVLKRKTAELVNNHKRQQLNSRKRRNRNSDNKSSDPHSEVSDKKQTDIMSWLDSEVEMLQEIVQTKSQIVEQEILLESVLMECNSDSCDSTGLTPKDEANSRKGILRQLRSNLESMEKSLVDGFKDASTWNELAEAEVAWLVGRAIEMIGYSKIEMREKIQKAVASTRETERKACNEEVMRLRLEHSQATASLLDSTRKALESEMIQQLGTFKDTASDTAKMDRWFKDYFQGAEAATASIRSNIDDFKTQQNEIQDAVNEVTKGLLPSKKQKKKSSVTKELIDYEPLEETFLLDDFDDGNDSDWSPEDEKASKKAKRESQDEKVDLTASTEEPEMIQAETATVKSPDARVSEAANTSFADAPTADFLSASFESKGDESLDTSRVESPESSVASSPEKPTESLEDLKVSELKERLRTLGLKMTGRKADLKARLESHQASQGMGGDKNRKPLQTLNNSFSVGRGNVNLRNRRNMRKPSFMKDNTSFSAKRRRDIPPSDAKRRLREDMNNSVTLALQELQELTNL